MNLANVQLILVAIVMAFGILLIDLWLPLGVAAGVPYVTLVFFGWWFPDKKHVYVLAIAGTALTLVGFWYSPEGGVFWVVLANRSLAIFIIWTSAALIIIAKQSGSNLLAAKQDAERTNNAKSDFLASISHELRTPLNAILGFTQLLKFDSEHPLTAKQIESTDCVLQAGDHLLSLINDVLDLAAMESGKVSLDIAQQDPTPIIESCVTMGHSLAKQRGLTFYDRKAGWGLPEINIDETRFRQVLLNLISNAVKYNRDGGTVTLSVEESEKGRLRITVTDTGKGIAAEKQHQLFTPFSRLGLESSDITGTGIGLTITKNLVEDMGGAIGFKSLLDLGSSFWLEFPIVGGAMTPCDAAPQANLTVLCVEDNPSNLKLLKSIIDQIAGATLISAHTGELGVDLANNHRPGVILMDINLPGISGTEALLRLKASPATRDIPVIAITAQSSESDKADGLKAGFSKYLTKPINLEELTSSLNQLLTPDSAA